MYAEYIEFCEISKKNVKGYTLELEISKKLNPNILLQKIEEELYDAICWKKREDIENVKKDWELNRLKALKEEEERKAELEEDEMLYTYSRDDAYQQVKKRNKLLASEAKKAAIEAKAAALSPSRSKGRASVGESEEEKKKAWVYKTPKIIRELVKKSSEVVDEEVSEGGGKLSNKKGKKLKVKQEEDLEEVDVETVSGVDELTESKKHVKKKLIQKLDKTPKSDKPDKPKRQRKSKGEGKTPKEKTKPLAPCSVEATRLESLPGFSVAVATNSLQTQITPTKATREGVFEKLHSPPAKSVQDRANIFEQFSVQAPVQAVNVSQSPGLENTLAGGTVRLVNTPQGQKIVVVSSSPSIQTPQNVVLVQGMQGFPQSLVVGNSVVSLQASPINMATFARTNTPINIQTSGLVGSPQVVNPRIGARIVTPVQVNQLQQNPTFVQRIVPGSQVANISSISGLSVPQLTSIPVPSGLPNLQQLNSASQLITSQAPLIQASGGQKVTIQNSQVVAQQIVSQQQPVTTAALIQPATVQRKSSVQTIADLIAAGKAKLPQPVRQAVPANFPNLSNIMKAQVPATIVSSSSQSMTQVKVNPAVAKLVASHIQAGQLSAQTATTASVQKTQGPAIINLGGTSRSQSPTIVKLVSASNLRPGSPVTVMGSKGQVVKAQVAGQTRGEAPVATINIKGLPPGVSIPASLVNSLVSGSIGGISKSGLNVIRGTVPVAGQVVCKGGKPSNATTVGSPALKPAMEANGSSPNVNRKTEAAQPSTQLPTPVIHVAKSQAITIGTSPVISVAKSKTPVNSPAQSPKVGKPVTVASPVTPQAWSNPNLVIRTRRAVKEGKSPQIITQRKESPAVQLPTPSTVTNVLTNHVSTTNVQIKASPNVDQIPLTVKKLEQTVSETADPQSNGAIDGSVEIK